MSEKGYNIQKDNPLPISSIDKTPPSAFVVRVHKAIQSGKLNNSGINILLDVINDFNKSESFDDLPPDTQQLILKAEDRNVFMIHNQINEVMSWRLITEIWRRFPKLFKLTEMHLGGGQSDCLSLITKEDKARIFILINRGGSIRVTDLASKSSKREEQISDWLDLMLYNQTDSLLKKLIFT